MTTDRHFPPLSPGQRKLLLLFAVFPRLMIRQATRLLYDASSYAFVAAKLRELYTLGYLLYRTRNGTTYRSDPFVYAPTRLGKHWLAAQGAAYFRAHGDADDRVKEALPLGHSLAITDVLGTAVCASTADPGIAIEEVRHDEHLRRDLAGRLPVSPDAFVRLRVDGNPVAFFLEVDRSGGEGKAVWHTKLAGYLAGGGMPYVREFTLDSLDIVVVVNLPPVGKTQRSARSDELSNEARSRETTARDRRRMRRLLLWTEQYLDAHGLRAYADCFSFTAARPEGLTGEAAVAFFTDHHWHAPFGERPHAFF